MNITVLKYDPAADASSYAVSGDVPYKEKMSALEALVYFHENIQAVNFDYNCACRLCGRCAMMLDNEPALICITPIDDKDHVFEPLKGYPVIRDLIVDKDALDRQLSGIFERVRLEPFNESTLVAKGYDPAVKDPSWAMEYCCRCGVCNASCPAVAVSPSEYVGPASMLAVAYRHLDPLDQGDRVLEAVGKGMYHCIMCGKCDEVCPQQDINHIEAWQTLRNLAEERDLKPSYA
jgi:succinate dehydrogenase/fumarate reductase iron-sulfur protein